MNSETSPFKPNLNLVISGGLLDKIAHKYDVAWAKPAETAVGGATRSEDPLSTVRVDKPQYLKKSRKVKCVSSSATNSSQDTASEDDGQTSRFFVSPYKNDSRAPNQRRFRRNVNRENRHEPIKSDKSSTIYEKRHEPRRKPSKSNSETSPEKDGKDRKLPKESGNPKPEDHDSSCNSLPLEREGLGDKSESNNDGLPGVNKMMSKYNARSPRKRMNASNNNDYVSDSDDSLGFDSPVVPKLREKLNAFKSPKVRKSLAPPPEMDQSNAQQSSSQRLKNTNAGSVSFSRKRLPWTMPETEKLYKGVREHGVGGWASIKSTQHFTSRTGVQLKDRWRTIMKDNKIMAFLIDKYGHYDD